jgi:hypothetical protein
MDKQTDKDSILQALAATDQELARVTEDLIGVLVKKGVILFTDLPAAVQAKLLDREALRSRLQSPSVSLLSEDDTL